MCEGTGGLDEWFDSIAAELPVKDSEPSLCAYRRLGRLQVLGDKEPGLL